MLIGRPTARAYVSSVLGCTSGMSCMKMRKQSQVFPLLVEGLSLRVRAIHKPRFIDHGTAQADGPRSRSKVSNISGEIHVQSGLAAGWPARQNPL